MIFFYSVVNNERTEYPVRSCTISTVSKTYVWTSIKWHVPQITLPSFMLLIILLLTTPPLGTSFLPLLCVTHSSLACLPSQVSCHSNVTAFFIGVYHCSDRIHPPRTSYSSLISSFQEPYQSLHSTDLSEVNVSLLEESPLIGPQAHYKTLTCL